jgi:uncharacterized LabA/DUF88 family protein
VIITGDADFVAVVKQLQIRGKKVLIIAEQNSLSHHLKKKCHSDNHISRISRKLFGDHHKRFKDFIAFTIKNGRRGRSL